MRRRPVLFDSNVLIGYLGAGRDADIVERPSDVAFLSAVVIKELRFGITDTAGLRLLGRLVEQFRKMGRILVPEWTAYERAGGVMQRMKSAGVAWQTASAFADVMIALSSNQIGATVVTRDADFERIRKIEAFALELLPKRAGASFR